MRPASLFYSGSNPQASLLNKSQRASVPYSPTVRYACPFFTCSAYKANYFRLFLLSPLHIYEALFTITIIFTFFFLWFQITAYEALCPLLASFFATSPYTIYIIFMLMPRVRTTKPVMQSFYYHRMEPSLYLGKLSFLFVLSNIFLVNEARLFSQQITPRVSETELGEPYGLPSPSSLPLPPVESVSPIPLPAHSPISSIASPPLPSTLPLTPAASPPKLSAPSPFNTPLRSPPPHLLSPPPKIAPSPPAHKAPPPPHKKPQFAVWCVAKPTVPDLLIQQALDYACGSGADCKSIQPNGPCFQPNTLVAHASYAFNSYWQKTKIAGGTCDFGGTAMLVTADPSYNNCYFTLI